MRVVNRPAAPPASARPLLAAGPAARLVTDGRFRSATVALLPGGNHAIADH